MSMRAARHVLGASGACTAAAGLHSAPANIITSFSTPFLLTLGKRRLALGPPWCFSPCTAAFYGGHAGLVKAISRSTSPAFLCQPLSPLVWSHISSVLLMHTTSVGLGPT
jgi:hypothetical protein